MATKKITYAEILVQTGEGTLNAYGAATLQATYTIEGRSLTNRVALFSGKIFNPKSDYKPSVRINGVVTGCAIKTSASTNNVELEAGTANVLGTLVTVSADATNAITRGANGKYAISLLSVNASGTVTVTKGADGDALDWTGGYGGAGQMPYTPATDAALGYVATFDDEAAVIPQTDIYLGDSANVSYRIDHLRGAIILNQAFAANVTGGLRRAIYVQFYDLSASLVAMGKVSDANLTITRDGAVETTSGDSVWKTYESTGVMGWTFNVTAWRPDQYWITKFLNPVEDKFLLKMKEDEADSHYYIGVGLLGGGQSITNKRGPVSQSLSFTGDGECRLVA